MILNFVRARALPILGVALALSVIANAAMGLALKRSWENGGALESALTTQNTRVIAAGEANKALKRSLDKLISDKQALIKQMAADKDQAMQALFERDQRISDMAAKAIEERREWNELINQKPQCGAFLRDSLADYCPDIAIRVRERSQSHPHGLRADDSL